MENNSCQFDPAEILKTEIPMIRKMISDECWYRGEKEHRKIEPKEVEEIVDMIVLRVGDKLREEAEVKIKSEKCIHDCEHCIYWKMKINHKEQI